MALQPWILGYSLPTWMRWNSLQWSHGPSAMDTTAHNPATHAAPRAFNGAMALQPWIPQSGRSWHSPTTAPSMEPWPFSHGYEVKHFPPTNAHLSLQWSHGPSAMDTAETELAYMSGKPPSMEPWPFSHGYSACLSSTSRATTSFNGAMALQPWIRPAISSTAFGWTSLQWSHGPSAMDTAQ